MEKPLAGSNPMLHFQIRAPSTGVRPPTTLFHGLLGTDIEKIMGDFWVIVNSLGTNHPRAYILLPHEVQALAVRNRGGKQAYWLPLTQYAVDAFEEQWQRVGQPRPAPPASST